MARIESRRDRPDESGLHGSNTDNARITSGSFSARLPNVAKAEYTLGGSTRTEREYSMSCHNCFRAAVMGLAVIALGWGQSFQKAAAQVPEEQRKQVVEALGPPFVVFREKVLDELKVSDEQRDKLMQHLIEQIMETGPFLDSLKRDRA